MLYIYKTLKLLRPSSLPDNSTVLGTLMWPLPQPPTYVRMTQGRHRPMEITLNQFSQLWVLTEAAVADCKWRFGTRGIRPAPRLLGVMNHCHALESCSLPSEHHGLDPRGSPARQAIEPIGAAFQHSEPRSTLSRLALCCLSSRNHFPLRSDTAVDGAELAATPAENLRHEQSRLTENAIPLLFTLGTHSTTAPTCSYSITTPSF